MLEVGPAPQCIVTQNQQACQLAQDPVVRVSQHRGWEGPSRGVQCGGLAEVAPLTGSTYVQVYRGGSGPASSSLYPGDGVAGRRPQAPPVRVQGTESGREQGVKGSKPPSREDRHVPCRTPV